MKVIDIRNEKISVKQFLSLADVFHTGLHGQTTSFYLIITSIANRINIGVDIHF